MTGFRADLPENATILCLGAHCDDIEIGCGGTLMTLQQRYPSAKFHLQVFSGEVSRPQETRHAADRMFGPPPSYSVDVQDFRASYFPQQSGEIKDFFEALSARVKPDLIFTHFLRDRHQDHELIAHLTWNTFRNHAILEYEIPKYEGDLAHPNVYVPIAEDHLARKIEMLMECFPSQRSRQWFDADLFRGHLRLRGVECNSPTRYAEAFHGRKLIFS
jgi:LmbE family N-acetylglucosaminyl deacetylase